MDHHRAMNKQRQRRRMRVRRPLRGRPGRPRLSVYRSHKHIAVQVIDDDQGKTLCAASTTERALKEQMNYGGNQDAATAVGKVIAERALAAGVKEVVFDRREYKYHGRVKALAEAAREGGLVF